MRERPRYLQLLNLFDVDFGQLEGRKKKLDLFLYRPLRGVGEYYTSIIIIITLNILQKRR